MTDLNLYLIGSVIRCYLFIGAVLDLRSRSTWPPVLSWRMGDL